MKAVIIEDEFHSREFLKSVVTAWCEGVEIVGTAESVPEGVALIEAVAPELVFLDIEMQSGTGFDLLQQVRNRDFEVIFTTAYDHYAIQAIKYSAIDYLLKPIDLDELQAAVAKVRERRPGQVAPVNEALELLLATLKNPATEPTKITLATSEGLEFVPLEQIIRLEAAGAYTTFFLKEGKKIMVSKNLKEYENLLPARRFFRIHNSHMINIDEVKKMLKTDGGYAVMNDGATVMISPKKKEEFLQRIMQR
ncbi:LytTR family DNA-binding domain-containing protein [Rhabdobacter roseus]|uniref:Two-component system LytT family response regulator n=1 Tax=Rhabdobacter roseus TaxID=1655419 RepID=A0A840TI59_9BACT|nr:LytTR family DNA-binding domain-containing protein [Rhabdobacter roseus]MBB5282635.1 two-component system LytT family response regulator [Rhabdobacter roseus]